MTLFYCWNWIKIVNCKNQNQTTTKSECSYQLSNLKYLCNQLLQTSRTFPDLFTYKYTYIYLTSYMEVLLLYLDKVFPTWVVICKANFSKAFHFTVCAGHIGFNFFLKEHFYFSNKLYRQILKSDPFLVYMKNVFGFIWPVHVHLKTHKLDYLWSPS